MAAKKTSTVDRLLKFLMAGDWENAIKVAGKFPDLGDHKEPIQQAYLAVTNPTFTRQIGKDPSEIIAGGVEALKERYKWWLDQMPTKVPNFVSGSSTPEMAVGPDGLTGMRTGPFPKFAQFLSKWVELVQRPEWGHNNACWWYNERASVSVLAGAAWLTNDGWAFEEFATRKGRTRSRRKGRGDLWFTVRADHFMAEAKQIWPSIGVKANEPLPYILDALDAACHAAREVDEGKIPRIGIVFVVPYLPKSEEPDLSSRVGAFLQMVNRERGGELSDCAMGWVFRRPGQFIPYDEEEDCLYPGVLMLIRPAK